MALQAQPPARKANPKLPPKLGEFLAYLDPATENTVIRLTDPATTSRSPASQNRHVSSRSPLLLFSNDRHGVMAPFTLDLKTAVLKQLAEPNELKTDTLLFDSAERACLFLDGQILSRVSLEHGKPKTLAEGIEDFHAQGARDQIVALRKGKLERVEEGSSTVLAEGASSRGLISPEGNACCFTREQNDGKYSLHIVPMGGGQAVEAARGAITCPSAWKSLTARACCFFATANRKTFLSPNCGKRPLMRPARGSFRAPRGLPRSPQTEMALSSWAPAISLAQPHHQCCRCARFAAKMTLCEHKSSRPELVRPVFSPNSQRVYFQSDRHGKPALYTLSVAQLVESTQPAP